MRTCPPTHQSHLIGEMVQTAASVLVLASLSLLSHGFVSISTASIKPNFGYSQLAANSVSEELPQLGLTPELEKYVTGFRNVGDDKLRYQQLFFLASKCKPMDDAFKIEQNKVCDIL